MGRSGATRATEPAGQQSAMVAWQAIAAWYTVASVVAIGAMAADKAAAGRGSRRVPERLLHALELCGGWAGSLAAVYLLRHKAAKVTFFAVSWLIAACHLGACAAAVSMGWIV